MIKNIIVSAIAAIVVSVLALSFIPASAPSPLGSTIETIRVTFGQGFDSLATSTIRGGITTGAITASSTTVGTNGTAITKRISGTATCGLGSPVIAPATTNTYNCAATGVVWPDRVFVTLSTTTPAWITLVGANASSTTGFFQIQLRNASTTGASLAVAGATSTVQYEAVR